MVTAYLYGRAAGIAAGAGIGVVIAVLWYGIALRR
jgi:hypothetical protein